MYYQIRVKSDGVWGGWISLSELGAFGLSRTLTTCAPDIVEFTVTGQDALTDASAFAYNAEVSMRRQSTDSLGAATEQYWFRGRVRSIPRYGSGTDESYRILIEGPWSWFNSTVFRQSWPEYAGEVLGSVSKPRAILFAAADGSRLATGPQLKAICDAAVAAGAPCTVSAMAGGITPPYDEQTNLTCAQAALRVLAYHPHSVLWFDYSTETPVLHFATRSALPTVDVALTDCDSLSVRQRDDLKVPAVAIYYERQNTIDGLSRPQTVLDKYPAGADVTADGVLTAVYDLRGNTLQTVSQEIVAEEFTLGWAASVVWWKARVPWLRDYADADITLSGGARLNDSSLSNLLVSGVPQEWLNVGIEKERVAVTVSTIARKTIGGVSKEVERVTKKITLEVWVTGAPVGSTVYRTVSMFDQGEETPAGIAQSLFTEWSQTHFEGAFSLVDQEPSGTITPGTAVNITGGMAPWATMKALVSRVAEHVDSGTTSVDFGPPGWTDIDSRVLFERSARSRQTANSMRFISGADVSTGISGAALPSALRDGISNQEHRRLLLCNPAASPLHQIDLDADAVVKSTDAAAAAVLSPREMYIPYVDTADNNRLKAKLAQVIASQHYGAAVDLGSTPGVPAAYDAQPSFWGEFSGASGGGSAPTANFWVASGVTGHSGNGLKLIVVMRSYLDNSLSTPNFYSQQCMLQFSTDGRLLAASLPYAYTVSATVAV